MAMNIDVDKHLTFTMNTKLCPMLGGSMKQSSGSYGYNPLFEGNQIDEIMWPVEITASPDDSYEVLVQKAGTFIEAFKTFKMRHFTITAPFKTAIIEHLDIVDDESRLFKSVNAVRVEPDGKLHGAGFDGKGNMAAIVKAGVDVKGMNVAILGAGSIVGVILLCMAEKGAKKVTLLNRTVEKAEYLRDTVKNFFKEKGQELEMEVECLPFDEASLDKAASECDFLMQATTQGLLGTGLEYKYLGFLDKLKPEAIVMENIVNPPMTKFAAKATENGHKVILGVDMMLGQLSEIFQFCFGFEPSDESMEKAKVNVYKYFGLDL